MDLTEFEKILNDTVTPANMDPEERRKKMETVLSYIGERSPSKLYKYRSFCDNHLSAFYKDQIWASTAQSMNDGFDARLYFNKEEFIKEYEKLTSIDKMDSFIEMLREDADLRDFVAKMPGGEAAIKNLELPDDKLKDGIEDAKKKIEPVILNVLNILPEVSQQSLKFCSLSETVRSASMWGQYSNDESGFCIEYDFSNALNECTTSQGAQVVTSLFPILYREYRYQVPASFINYLIQYRMFYENAVRSNCYHSHEDIIAHINQTMVCPDTFLTTKIVLYKSLEWQYEKEWRLICFSVDGDPQFNQADHICFTMKPAAVYLGRRVSEVNEKIMRSLAGEKSIPVYKMKLDDSSPTYEMTYL